MDSQDPKNTVHRSHWSGIAMLTLTAVLWGSTFVAQSTGMNYIGPFTFLCARSAVGVLFLLLALPLLDVLHVAKKPPDRFAFRRLWKVGLFCGMALFSASAFQQCGIVTVDSGKTAFITALYMVMVPIAGLLFGRKVGPAVWSAVVLAVGGMYLLCMTESEADVGIGELLVFCAAIGYTAHILIIDFCAGELDSIRLSCIQFVVVTVLSGICAFLFEKPNLEAVIDCTLPILYAGILSSGVAYTLQILAQKVTEPTVASLLMSLESVFAAIFGAIILGERLTPFELAGCALIFGAILLTQLPIGFFSRGKKHGKE